jgi:hypothetical protein
MLGLGFPTLRKEEGRKAIKEAEGLYLGLLSSRDGQFMLVLVISLGVSCCLGWVRIGVVRVRVRVGVRVGVE